MSAEVSGNELFAGIFSRGPAARQVGAAAWLTALLEVEAALARAAARAGLVSAEAAALVTAAAVARNFDLDLLGAQSADTGNPVPALVERLSASLPEQARSAVHVGATSQDILDTALMLLAKRATSALASDLTAAADAAAALADRHRADIMLGRTLLQQAVPITFGLKAAGWLTALDQAHAGLMQLLRTRAVLQFGGAAGTLAALGGRGPELSRLLAEELGLVEPLLPWHSLRLPLLEWATGLALAGAALGKIARDITLLAQTEVAEVSEAGAPGRGGSSSMPHKQNPVAAVAVLGCTRRLPGLLATLLAAAEHEHERAAGAWHSEWESFADLLRLTGSAAAWTRELLGGLRVDSARMRANYDAAGGLPLAEHLSSLLAPALGRREAHAFVKQAAAHARATQQKLEHTLLHEAALADVLREAGVGSQELTKALDPAGYLGSTETFIARALAAHAVEKEAGP
jgi:3-carboxy-cis,cis-muconate cycloisomerase